MREIETGESVLVWARENAEGFSFTAAANNYPMSDRRYDIVTGYIYRYANSRTDGDTHYIIIPDEPSDKFSDALFVIDDGRSVVVTYTAGYGHDEHGAVNRLYAHPFPTDYRPDGTRRMRGDDESRPVDMSTWGLGPTRAYHCKVRGAISVPADREPRAMTRITVNGRHVATVPDGWADKVSARYVGSAATYTERSEWRECGDCGSRWDDAIGTAFTPAPAARCPFEYEHGL